MKTFLLEDDAIVKYGFLVPGMTAGPYSRRSADCIETSEVPQVSLAQPPAATVEIKHPPALLFYQQLSPGESERGR